MHLLTQSIAASLVTELKATDRRTDAWHLNDREAAQYVHKQQKCHFAAKDMQIW
jgi:hypothetical protein